MQPAIAACTLMIGTYSPHPTFAHPSLCSVQGWSDPTNSKYYCIIVQVGRGVQVCK